MFAVLPCQAHELAVVGGHVGSGGAFAKGEGVGVIGVEDDNAHAGGPCTADGSLEKCRHSRPNVNMCRHILAHAQQQRQLIQPFLQRTLHLFKRPTQLPNLILPLHRHGSIQIAGGDVARGLSQFAQRLRDAAR